MAVFAAIVVVVVVVVLVGVALAFNTLVRRRTRVDAGWAQIDVELKRRHDLVPNLVEAVRGAAGYERGVLERITTARAQAAGASPEAARAAPGDVSQRAGAEQELTASLRTIFANREAYPALTANANFRSLQEQLATTEDRIAYARAYYNAAVAEYERSRTSFPSGVVAAAFGFEPRAYFEADVQSQAPVEVDLGPRA